MENIPSELVTIGGIALLILAAVILAKYGKQIVTLLLVLGGIALVLFVGIPLLGKIDTQGASETLDDAAAIARFLTPQEQAPAQPTYQPPQKAGGGLLSGVLLTLCVGSLCVGGYFYARWKLAERGGPRAPHQHKQQGQPIIYVIEGQADDLGEYDLAPWGWKEGDQWIEGDLFQF